VRRKEKYRSTFRIQRAERQRKRHFGRIFICTSARRILLWRRLRLPLTLNKFTLDKFTLDKSTGSARL
jgi:hypothetical protein